MYTINFPDGTKLTNLTRDYEIFTADKKIDFGIFEGRLHDVEITSDDKAQQDFTGKHRLLNLTKIVEDTDTMFILRDADPKDVAIFELQAQAAYLSMMSGIELP